MRDVATPTRARPPLVRDDTPPALYALIHSSIPQETPPPFKSKSNTPTPIYIFV